MPKRGIARTNCGVNVLPRLELGFTLWLSDPVHVRGSPINSIVQMPIRAIKEYLKFFRGIATVTFPDHVAERGLDIAERYQMQFYDSLLLATAEANGCREFISEDLNDGQIYCGMKIVNPFKA